MSVCPCGCLSVRDKHVWSTQSSSFFKWSPPRAFTYLLMNYIFGSKIDLYKLTNNIKEDPLKIMRPQLIIELLMELVVL